MHALYVFAKSKIPLGSGIGAGGAADGNSGADMLWRIVRSGGGIGFYDHTAAPVLEAGEKLCFYIAPDKAGLRLSPVDAWQRGSAWKSGAFCGGRKPYTGSVTQRYGGADAVDAFLCR